MTDPRFPSDHPENAGQLEPMPDDAYPADAVELKPAGPRLRDLTPDVSPVETTEAGLPGQVIRVVLEDGTEFVVRTTNKDYIRWDKTSPARRAGVKNFQDAPFIFASFLGWAAARRLGQTSLTFDQFLELADVVERQSADEVPPTR